MEKVLLVLSTNNSTITLPAVSSNASMNGFKVHVKRVGSGTVTVTGNSNEQIETASNTFALPNVGSTVSLVAYYQGASLVNWFII